MITQKLAVIAAAFALAACDKPAPDAKITVQRAEFPHVAPDWKTAQCISDEMDSMFERGDLKDESPPGKDHYTYSLRGDAYKKVVADCEQKTGQKTLYPHITGAVSYSPKVWPPR